MLVAYVKYLVLVGSKNVMVIVSETVIGSRWKRFHKCKYLVSDISSMLIAGIF